MAAQAKLFPSKTDGSISYYGVYDNGFLRDGRQVQFFWMESCLSLESLLARYEPATTSKVSFCEASSQSGRLVQTSSESYNSELLYI